MAERYGKSPAMAALPALREWNAGIGDNNPMRLAHLRAAMELIIREEPGPSPLAWQCFFNKSQLAAIERDGLMSRAECDAVRDDRDFWIVRDWPHFDAYAPIPFQPRLTRPMSLA